MNYFKRIMKVFDRFMYLKFMSIIGLNYVLWQGKCSPIDMAC